MAFTSTVKDQTVFGNKRIVTGVYDNSVGATTGGDIATGLARVDGIILQPYGAAVGTNQAVINETFPLVNSTGAVTIVTDASQVGEFIAWGV